MSREKLPGIRSPLKDLALDPGSPQACLEFQLDTRV